VALLHGLYGQALNFATVQRRLAEAGHRAIALDLRNHGSSPHDDAMAYAAMAQDVVETLRARAALPSAVIGHSMGGKVAMRLALTQPGAVTRLLVEDIAPVAYEHAEMHDSYLDAMLAIPLTPGLTRGAADAALAEAVLEPAIRGFLLQSLRFGEVPAWRLNLSAIRAALPALTGWEAPPGARWGGPALFLSGERSDFVGPAERAAALEAFPRATFTTIPHAGHWVHAEDPDGFVQAALAFLG
jgi:pimeloyl-ACP methyl ester carboxylesterase